MTKQQKQQFIEAIIENNILYNATHFVDRALSCDGKEWREAGYSWDNLENLEEDTDVLEWWAVTKLLAKFLRECGQVIIETDDGIFWGRQTSGQSITLDYAIEEVVEKCLDR